MRKEKEHMKIVIVGHVDHGKSTLIGRLFYDTDSIQEEKIAEVREACKTLGKEMEFAYLMDHLQEEREQGVTIDTTQTFFKTDKRHYVIIDAPGHKEFIKNMITGASQAEAAILIVDADEGVQEQTKRHAYILGMLGLKQVIAVLNKMDLREFDKERFEEVKAELLKFLSSISIVPSHVIPISAKLGENVAKKSGKMKWYSGPTILSALDSFSVKESSPDKPLRFPVQGVFKVENKRILMGRVESGTVSEGDEITFLPSGKTAKVKSVEEFMEERHSASAGESTGITIDQPYFIERGEVAFSGRKPAVAQEFSASVFWMSPRAFALGERLAFRCATQEAGCEVKKIERKINSSTLETIGENASELKENEVGEIVLRTDKPVVLENFSEIPELGRFVLVRGENVSAGGTVSGLERLDSKRQ